MKELVERQRQYFDTQVTFPLSWRKEQLKKLYQSLNDYEEEIFEAFRLDLKKPPEEVYFTEIGIVKRNIRHTIKHMTKWAQSKRVHNPLTFIGKRGSVQFEPRGTVLIIGPYNYPLQLLLEPLIGAIAAGNTAVLKASELVPNISTVLAKIIEACFDDKYVKLVEGDATVATQLLEQDFDLVFFTGSERVGKLVMEKAAQNLTPVVLELGGKSPVVVFGDADLEVSAQRIVWGKFINGGQTCIAPDYVLVAASQYQKFVELCIEATKKMFSNKDDQCKMVNQNHANRIASIIHAHQDQVVFGGKINGLEISPTILCLNDTLGKVMEAEIFGPILPIIPYDKEEDILPILNKHRHPLALYLFTKNKRKAQVFAKQFASGGTVINDTIMHVAHPSLPFGGVRSSGIGRYHGKYSFETFSHLRAIMTSSTRIKLTMIFPPYQGKLKLFKRTLK